MPLIRVRVPMARPLRCNLKRFLKLMPSILLLLFVFSLIFVTLMQIAIIHTHRRTHYASRQNVLNGTPGTYPLVTGYNAQTGVKNLLSSVVPTKVTTSKRSDTLRVEAFLDKNAPSIEANVIIIQNLANAVRIKHVLESVNSVVQLNCERPIDANGAFENRTNTYGLVSPTDVPKDITSSIDCDLHSTRANESEKYRKKHSCPKVPVLAGRLKVDMSSHNLTDLEDLLRRSPYMRGRGSWTPQNCTSSHRVAIIIPYRDRLEHLVTLLYTLHPILQRQLIEYNIFVVEQYGSDTFNKGILMNAGVKEALRQGDFHCFVFHDVDMIPEDDRNMYSCPPMPRHMSVAVDKFNYTLPYYLLVGGVFAIRIEHYLTVNGYSNLYWGWGGEDDDMGYRVKYKKLEIIRPPESLARYTMIKHDHRPESPNGIRRALLRMAKKRSPRDGLNTAKYRVVYRHDLLPYTHLMIDIGQHHRWQFLNGQRLVINF